MKPNTRMYGTHLTHPAKTQEVTLCIPHYRGHGSESISRTDAPASAPPNSFVTYEIVVSTSHEVWSVARRCVYI